jgi:hypothetical protein
MADQRFDDKEKEVLSKWQHWKNYIDTIEGKDKDKSEQTVLKIKQRARPLVKACGNCLRGY